MAGENAPQQADQGHETGFINFIHANLLRLNPRANRLCRSLNGTAMLVYARVLVAGCYKVWWCRFSAKGPQMGIFGVR